MYNNTQIPQQAGYGYNMYQQPMAPQFPYAQPMAPYYDPNSAYMYAPNQGVIVNTKAIKPVSTSTPEDDALLKNTGVKVFQIRDIDIAIARCNHKDHDGNIKVEIIDAEVSRCKCSKCGKEWNLIKPSQEVVNELVSMFLDLFQSIKLCWLTPPKEFAEQVYIIQALIEKVPEMYKLALKDWQSRENQINNQIQPVYPGNYYNNGLSQIPMIQNYYQQPPVMQQPYQFMQPQQQMAQPYQQQQMAQPVPVNGNGMMQSQFVQGGIVTNPIQQPQAVPVQSAVPQFMQPQQPMAPVQQPAVNVQQPGAPTNNSVMQPPQQQPVQVATATTTL